MGMKAVESMGKWLKMPIGWDPKDGEDLRSQIFYRLSFSFAVVGLVPICIGAYKFLAEGRALAALVEIAFYAGIIGATFSGRMSIAKKRAVFIYGYYAMSLMLLLLTGQKGSGFILVSSVLALGGIVLDQEQSWQLALGNLFVFAGLSLLLYGGFLDGLAIAQLKDTWFLLTLTSQSLGLILLLLISWIYDRLERQAKELRVSKAAVEASEERFYELFEKAPLGYQSLDGDARFLDVNRQWLDTLGYEREEVLGQWFGDFLLPEGREALKVRFSRFKEVGHVVSEFAMVKKDGDLIHVEFVGKIGYKEDGSFKQTHCILKDVTERRQIEKALKESEERHKRLYEYSGVAISYFSLDGTVISFNRRAAANMGGMPGDFQGKGLHDLFPEKNADAYLDRIRLAAESGESLEYEDQVPIGDTALWFLSTYSRILDADGQVSGVQIASLDVTVHKALEQDLFQASHHDFLTGLYNRRYFEMELEKSDVAGKLPLTLVMADLNGLKMINDSFGHDAGDRLLRAAAKAIQGGCREGYTVARTGGDEFAILMPHTSQREAEKLVEGIQDRIARQEIEHAVLSVSFGLATKVEGSQEIRDIFAEAENRMYKQKIYESSSMRSQAIDVIMNGLYEKSQRELSHSKRVGWLCARLAEGMGFAPKQVKQMELAGLVHDIGKIGVDEKVLNKAGLLTHEEWDQIRNHPEAGWRILSSVHEFSEIAKAVLSHHERWDGTGYPRGLDGGQIPLEARIIAVADAFDAMTSQRTYRDPMPVPEAVEEIRIHAGSQFDPSVVEVFLDRYAKFKEQVFLTDESDFSSLRADAQEGLLRVEADQVAEETVPKPV